MTDDLNTDEKNIHPIYWYVVQTKPLAEDIVRQHFTNAQFETFLPKIQQMVRGRQYARVKSLFPSYIFVHLDLNDANLYRMIKYTRGVRRILGNGIHPISVPDEMIEIIRERISTEGFIEQRLVLKKGEPVRIRSGPFRDLVGILDKPVSAKGRVQVLLNIMHHQIKCQLSAAEVEKIS